MPMNHSAAALSMLRRLTGSVCTGNVHKVTQGDSPQHLEAPSISLITVYAMVSNHIMINGRFPPLK